MDEGKTEGRSGSAEFARVLAGRSDSLRCIHNRVAQEVRGRPTLTWTPMQDKLLLQMVAQYGAASGTRGGKKWSKMGRRLERTGKQAKILKSLFFFLSISLSIYLSISSLARSLAMCVCARPSS